MTVRKLSLFLALSTLTAVADSLPQWAQEYTGTNLLAAMRAHMMPTRLCDADDFNETLLSIDRIDSDDITLNRFSNGVINYNYFRALPLFYASPSWIGPTNSAEYIERIEKDLYNYFPCPSDISNKIINGLYGPGFPTQRITHEGNCTLGENNDNVGVWEYPADYAGEMARNFLYMATVHPVNFAGSVGDIFLTNLYPYIKPEALGVLLEWHSAHPPTPRELERNRRIAEVQGNSNLFVEYPELVNRAWSVDNGNGGGSYDDNPTGDDDPSEGDDDNPVDTPTFLKGRYAAGDKWLWLMSPYIEENATWTIDGTPAEGLKIELSTLSKGEHLLEFTGQHSKGRLKIFVE